MPFRQKCILTHGRCLLLLHQASARKTTDFLRKGIAMLWFRFKVENFIIVFPTLNQSQYSFNESVHRLVEMNHYDIFSWLPYEANHCDDQFQAVLMDKCYMENFEELLHNVQLFINKTPNKFAGCCMSRKGQRTTAYTD